MAITNDRLRWLIDITVFMTPITHTNFSTNTVNNSAIKNGYRVSSGAQSDAISFDVILAKGTWTLELLHTKGTDTGIYTAALAGSSVGTIDGYGATTTYNNRSTITGIIVTKSGKKRMSLTMATKNGSSSSYFGRVQHIQWRRTA